MGMLTGLQAPTAGSIDVFGLNGVDDIDAVRQNSMVLLTLSKN